MADKSYVQSHVEAPDLEVGMHVEVNRRHSGEGTFTGTITEITNEAIAHIRPDSADVRRFLGDGDYVLGSAHWPSSVRVLDGKGNLTCRIDEFTVEEVGMLKGVVRTSVRKQDKNRTGLVRSFGDAADLSSANARTALLESIYRKLGGDPGNIANHTHEDRS